MIEASPLSSPHRVLVFPICSTGFGDSDRECPEMECFGKHMSCTSTVDNEAVELLGILVICLTSNSVGQGAGRGTAAIQASAKRQGKIRSATATHLGWQGTSTGRGAASQTSASKRPAPQACSASFTNQRGGGLGHGSHPILNEKPGKTNAWYQHS